MLVSNELCPSIDDFSSTLQSLQEKHAPLRRRRVRADRLEPSYRDVKDELEAAKKHAVSYTHLTLPTTASV